MPAKSALVNMWPVPTKPVEVDINMFSDIQKYTMLQIQYFKWYITCHSCLTPFIWKINISLRISFVFYWFVNYLLGCIFLSILATLFGFCGNRSQIPWPQPLSCLYYQTNTYQTVLATDGLRSFVFFVYKNGAMEWQNVENTPTVLGFNNPFDPAEPVNLHNRLTDKYRPDKELGNMGRLGNVLHTKYTQFTGNAPKYTPTQGKCPT